MNINPISDNTPHKRKNIGDPYPKLSEKAFSANKIRAAEVHLLARIMISLKEFILNLINIPQSWHIRDRVSIAFTFGVLFRIAIWPCNIHCIN